jgi:crossover junction endodeoxyribonuclease RuvC
MRILGIDPGTATTGYGLVSSTLQGGLETIDFGVIETPAGIPLEKRLLLLYRRLKELMILHLPDGAAVEKIFFQRNVKTAISVSQARGVILLALAESDLKIGEYTPLEIKLAVAGYGGADKNQMQQMVRAILGLPEIPRPDDAADALAIAICHINSTHVYNEILG